MNGELAPSILSFPLIELGQAVPIMVENGADWIHFDVMDGQFVPPITFGDQLVRDLRRVTPAKFEVHLMTLTPERQFDAFISAGCNRVIFHAEATVHAHRLIQQIKEAGAEAGVAINPATPVAVLEPILADIDLALVMTVNPGWGGQKLIASTLDKVRHIRALRPEMSIEVDGGIDAFTVAAAKEAGANVFVVGSHLAKADDLGWAVRNIKDLLV